MSDSPSSSDVTASAQMLSEKRGRPPLVSHIVAIVVALLMAIASFWLFTRHNDFPPDFYHPDEPGKVMQLAGESRWNFNHPVLLLQTAWLAKLLFHVPPDERSLAILGRTISAALAAVAVFAAAMTGYITHRFIGLLLCGVAIALCPPLLINAHFFKEDASLIGGMMLAIFGVRCVVHATTAKTRRLAIIAMGIGCATAASGKLVGIFTVVPALAALRATRDLDAELPRKPRRTFLKSALIAFALLNFHAVVLLPLALGGMLGEVGHAISGHFGLGLSVPNVFAPRIAIGETMPLVWIFLGAGLLWMLAVRRRVRTWDLILALFPLTFAIALAMNRIPIPRYALPLTVCFHFMAAQYVCNVLTDIRKPFFVAPSLAVVVIAAFVLIAGPRCLAINEQFRNDHRQRLYDWVAKQTPANAKILIDGYTALHGDGDPWRHPDQPRVVQDIDYRMFAADAGSLDAIVRQGVDYVATANMDYDRFFDPAVSSARGREAWFDQHRKFYEDLFARGKLVWSSAPTYQTNSYVGMDLRVYEVGHLRNVAR